MKPYQVKSSRIVWSCPWYSVRQDEIVTPDGRDGLYHTVQKGNAVWVIPVTLHGQIVMIYNYRYTVDDWCWEVPAGSVKPGQTLVQTARDELREEVGGMAQELRYKGQFYPANGICDEVGHIYLATGVTLGEPAHEPAEVMEIHLKPIAQVLQMAQANEISDGPSALVLLLCSETLRTLAVEK